MSDMTEVFAIFKELQSTSKKTEKAKILKDNERNILFQDTLKWLLNPFIITGISSKKIDKKVSPKVFTNDFDPERFIWTTIKTYLENHNTGTDKDVAYVQAFIINQPKDMRDLYKQLITKSLKLGIDAKTVNSVYGKGFVPVFDVQLGTPLDKVKLKGDEYIYISQKLNGCRCVSFNNKLFTRSGKEYTGLDHIISDIQKFNLPDLVFDGELIRKNIDGKSDSENFQIGTGIANSKGTDKTCLEYVIFDCLPKNEFMAGKSLFKYGWRKKYLIDIIAKKIKDNNIKNLRIVPMWYEGTDHSQIQKWLDYAEETDKEGVILNLNTTYKCKRTKELIKVKCFYDCDIKCIDIEQGTGKNANTLGSILCEYKNNIVKVGSGFTDEMRNYYWNNPNEIIDKIVTVKYKEETQNKDGSYSLQFPVFQAVRFDKSEPNI
jgi:DNA ligase-1